MSLSPTALEQALALLETVTPLSTDCGRLCSAACCQEDPEEPSGMLLFPGEAERYRHQGVWMTLLPSHILFRGQPVPLLTCQLPCPRKLRPLACRLFPLTPLVKGERVRVRMDPRAQNLCPLYSSGVEGLHPDFVSAVRQAADVLFADPLQADYLRLLTHHIQQYDWL